MHACSVTQSCLTLCDPMDYIAHQAPLSMGFSRQEYWAGLPCPHPGDRPNPAIEAASLTSPALAGEVFTTSTTGEAPMQSTSCIMLGWMSTSWNQGCWEKYQQPQIRWWYHVNGRKWRGTKEPLDEGERGECKKLALFSSWEKSLEVILINLTWVTKELEHVALVDLGVEMRRWIWVTFLRRTCQDLYSHGSFIPSDILCALCSDCT